MRLQQIAAVRAQLQFVPSSKPTDKADIDKLQEFVNNSTNLLVLTGAGLSTESGIPDYRYSLSGKKKAVHLQGIITVGNQLFSM